MIMQITHVVEDCPVCGRPVEVAHSDLGRTVGCAHCGGRFTVFKTDSGGTIAMPCSGYNLVERADRLLEVTAREADREPQQEHPTAIVAEPRDEVFARLATDLAEAGMRVVRARTASEAIRHCASYEPTLIIANLDLPDQSGWLLAGKVRFVDPDIRVWLYQPRATSYEKGMAQFLKVDELLDYAGDLLGLSETVIRLMEDSTKSDATTNDGAELAAA